MVREERRTEVCLLTVLLAFGQDNAACKPSLTSLYMAEHEGTGLDLIPSAGRRTVTLQSAAGSRLQLNTTQ